MSAASPQPLRRPSSTWRKWLVAYKGVFVAAFDTRAQLDEWMAIPPEESTLRVARDQLDVFPPASRRSVR